MLHIIMVLVPLGINLNSWTRSIDPKSKNRSTVSHTGMFSNDTGTQSFHRVESPSSTGKNSITSKIKQTVVSPVTQLLAQTKEKEKLSDKPKDAPVSLNMAASSSTSKRKKKNDSGNKKKESSKRPRNMKTTIKRLQKKRNNQSKAGSGSGNKSTSKKKSYTKKT